MSLVFFRLVSWALRCLHAASALAVIVARRAMMAWSTSNGIEHGPWQVDVAIDLVSCSCFMICCWFWFDHWLGLIMMNLFAPWLICDCVDDCCCFWALNLTVCKKHVRTSTVRSPNSKPEIELNSPINLELRTMSPWFLILILDSNSFVDFDGHKWARVIHDQVFLTQMHAQHQRCMSNKDKWWPLL